MNTNIEIGDNYVQISAKEDLNPVDVQTLGYPGFPTDLQQPLVTLLTQCNGISNLEETIYENRFQNIPYLNEMGANIEINGKSIKINGPSKLVGGKEVKATDLRAGAAMVIAGLVANGETEITEIEHIDRGYFEIEKALASLGVNIVRISE
jgi:UDP-N-acetylglucosamine 1-carboxyvinyltransferase